MQIAAPGDFVLGLFGKAGTTTAFMVINRDYTRESEAVLHFSQGLVFLEELDRRTGRWFRYALLSPYQTIPVRLAPGDGRLFRISAVLRGKIGGDRGATLLLEPRK